jgi:hypothetical protein
MMSQQQQLFKQELTASQILRIHGKSLGRSVGDIQMGMMEDVPSVSSCRTMVGKVEMIHTLQKNYWERQLR